MPFSRATPAPALLDMAAAEGEGGKGKATGTQEDLLIRGWECLPTLLGVLGFKRSLPNGRARTGSLN